MTFDPKRARLLASQVECLSFCFYPRTHGSVILLLQRRPIVALKSFKKSILKLLISQNIKSNGEPIGAGFIINLKFILGTLTTLSIAFSAFIGGGIENQSMSRTTPLATSSQAQERITTQSKVKIATSTPDISVRGIVSEYFADVPDLVDVARCESRFRQFDKNGRVLRGEVNKSDIGVMQINEYYHGEKAKELGLDIYTIEGNLSYARFLYDREGLTPWLSSSKCWKGNELALR